jgi:hypothetical protein
VAQPPELAPIVERRRLLVARSSDLRSELARDLGEVRSSTVWVERGYSWLRSGRALLPLVAGAAGLILAYRKGGLLGTAQKLVSVFQLASKVGAVIRTVLERTPAK